MTCTVPVLPLREKKMRACGQPVTHLVGPDKKPRCHRHALMPRARGEVVVPVGGKR